MAALETNLIKDIEQPEKILAKITILESSPKYLTPNTLKALEDIIDQHR